jgi:CheY-like chemotaxis protein
MGVLRGDVGIFSFADLLQHLAGAQKTGTLVIVQGQSRKEIVLSPDGMRLLSTSSRKTSSLGEILIRTRKINRAQLDQLLAEQAQTGRRLGEIVSRQGMVTKTDIEAALREQAQEEIYDLFSWTEARFEFAEGPPPPKPADFPLAEVVVDASPTSIMLEAARRVDELAVIMKVIRDETMIPIRTTKPFSSEKLGLNPDLLEAVYGQINARAGVAEVIRLSLYPRFEALRALYVLVTKGYLKILDREGATAVHLISDSTKVRMAKPGSGAALAPSPYAVPAGSRRSILLLGDMVKYRAALAAIVREAGYASLEDTALQAMSLLTEDRKVDCVILDIGLGNADEYQFVGWLCENTRAPVIVLSSDASKEAALTAVQKGARAYVVKPFTRDAILRTLSGVFQPSGTYPAPTRAAQGRAKDLSQ